MELSHLRNLKVAGDSIVRLWTIGPDFWMDGTIRVGMDHLRKLKTILPRILTRSLAHLRNLKVANAPNVNGASL